MNWRSAAIKKHAERHKVSGSHYRGYRGFGLLSSLSRAQPPEVNTRSAHFFCIELQCNPSFLMPRAGPKPSSLRSTQKTLIMEIKITDYLPAIDEIGEDTLADARQRILDYLHTKEEFKTVDMRPNSVFGDLVLSPLSHILAAFETGTSRMFSDLDLSNVAAGTIYNCDFVKKYLDNFGQGQVYEYPSTGVVQLQFSSPDPKLVDAGSKFLFEGDNGIDYIYEMIGIVDYLSLQSPYGDIDLNNPDWSDFRSPQE